MLKEALEDIESRDTSQTRERFRKEIEPLQGLEVSQSVLYDSDDFENPVIGTGFQPGHDWTGTLGIVHEDGSFGILRFKFPSPGEVRIRVGCTINIDLSRHSALRAALQDSGFQPKESRIPEIANKSWGNAEALLPMEDAVQATANVVSALAGGVENVKKHLSDQ